MNNYRHILSLSAGSTLLISTLLSSGCASDTSPNTQQGAVAGAIAGAVIGGIIGHQSGETVPHLHVHLLGQRPLGWPPG